jgi:hypothetical protein
MYFKKWEYFMGQKKNGFRIEYFLMIIVSFFWAIGHPLGSMILKKIHPFQLGSLTLSIGFIGLTIFLIISRKIREIARSSR